MHRTIIIGAGRHGQFLHYISKDKYNIVGYIDDDINLIGKKINGLQVLSDFDNIHVIIGEYNINKVILGLGEPYLYTRTKYTKTLKELGLEFVNVIHPTAIIEKNVTIGKGVFVGPGVIINSETIIGDNSVIYTGATIDHNCIIEENAWISPGVHLGGSVRVCKNSLVGIGSNVNPGITIGSNCKIGSGTVVLHDVPRFSTMIGCPGKVMKDNYIYHSKPTIEKDDIESLKNIVKVSDFEDKFSKYLGVKDAVATSSGTGALHLALLALGIKEEDEVILPSYMCTSPLNAINYIGAKPVVSDIDIDDISGLVTKKTKAIIVPHMFGYPSVISDYIELGIPIIEDCAHALGAKYKGKRIGTFGDVAIFSFYKNKMISTGEGGMVVSNNKDITDTVRDLNEYDMKEDYKVRYNYKMSDLQATLGISQLSKVDEFIRKRRTIADCYMQNFNNLYEEEADYFNVYYRYIYDCHCNVDQFISNLKENGIECAKPVFKPIHTYLGLNHKLYSNTEYAMKHYVSIPIYPSLSESNVNRIIEDINAEINSNSKSI